jgi:hypothetical protein
VERTSSRAGLSTRGGPAPFTAHRRKVARDSLRTRLFTVRAFTFFDPAPFTGHAIAFGAVELSIEHRGSLVGAAQPDSNFSDLRGCERVD